MYTREYFVEKGKEGHRKLKEKYGEEKLQEWRLQGLTKARERRKELSTGAKE